MARTRRGAWWLAFAVLVAALSAVAASCGGGDGGGESTEVEGLGSSLEEIQELAREEGQVNLVAWAGYVEDGSTDPDVDWVTGFESETGCQVNTKLGNTSDEMVTLMRTGQYDSVSASGDATSSPRECRP